VNVALSGLLLISVTTVGVSNAAPPPASPSSDGITRRVVEQHVIEGTSKVLELILVQFPPGAQSPPHTHPAVGLNYIVAGKVDSQYEGELVKHYQTGDTYQDPIGKKHLMFRNTSQTEPLLFLIAVELEPGQSFVQPLP
jgi:quercetin dioxygenase-like cupin family protein